MLILDTNIVSQLFVIIDIYIDVKRSCFCTCFVNRNGL